MRGSEQQKTVCLCTPPLVCKQNWTIHGLTDKAARTKLEHQMQSAGLQKLAMACQLLPAIAHGSFFRLPGRHSNFQNLLSQFFWICGHTGILTFVVDLVQIRRVPHIATSEQMRSCVILPEIMLVEGAPGNQAVEKHARRLSKDSFHPDRITHPDKALL